MHRHSLCPLILARDKTMHHPGAQTRRGNAVSHPAFQRPLGSSTGASGILDRPVIGERKRRRSSNGHDGRRHRVGCLTCKSRAAARSPSGWRAGGLDCPSHGAWLPTHAVKGIAKAMLSCETNVIAARHIGAAFTDLFFDDAIRTWWGVLESDSCRRFFGCHRCDETRKDDDGHSHNFPHPV